MAIIKTNTTPYGDFVGRTIAVLKEVNCSFCKKKISFGEKTLICELNHDILFCQGCKKNVCPSTHLYDLRDHEDICGTLIPLITTETTEK